MKRGREKGDNTVIDGQPPSKKRKGEDGSPIPVPVESDPVVSSPLVCLGPFGYVYEKKTVCIRSHRNPHYSIRTHICGCGKKITQCYLCSTKRLEQKKCVNCGANSLCFECIERTVRCDKCYGHLCRKCFGVSVEGKFHKCFVPSVIRGVLRRKEEEQRELILKSRRIDAEEYYQDKFVLHEGWRSRTDQQRELYGQRKKLELELMQLDTIQIALDKGEPIDSFVSPVKDGPKNLVRLDYDHFGDFIYDNSPLSKLSSKELEDICRVAIQGGLDSSHFEDELLYLAKKLYVRSSDFWYARTYSECQGSFCCFLLKRYLQSKYSKEGNGWKRGTIVCVTKDKIIIVKSFKGMSWEDLVVQVGCEFKDQEPLKQTKEYHRVGIEEEDRM